jgi:hypothetical protein
MKKIYQKPVIELEDMNMEELMKTSIPFGDPVDNAGVAEGRGSRFSTWEDDIEE